jgi:exosortase C (VPDSG-CTERM-specific)
MPPEIINASPPASAGTLSPLVRRQFRLLAVCTVVLAACFAAPLWALVRFALHSELYSHILLIPFVSVYLAWLKKNEFLHDSEPDRKLALLPLAAGLISSVGFLALHSRLQLAPVNSLAWNVFSFLLLFIGACFLSLGRQALRALAFPIGFLIFLVPFPVIVREAIEWFLQHRSADGAELLFGLVGTPLLRHGVDFQLPGFGLQVAPECSGIRSTLVLFITSLVAGQLFLRSPWKRALFVLAIIPLGIFRNAFRIVTIGELCVHVDPGFIDSPIHHRGGPVFFLISMVPFVLLLYFLRRTEIPKQKPR